MYYNQITKKSLFIALFSLFFVVGLKAQKTPIDRFEKEIVQFEQQDRETGNIQNAIEFTGSSSIRMWKSLARDMAPMKVINRGFGGSTLPELLHYADRIILPYHPKILVVYCGENDLAIDKTKARTVVRSFRAFSRYLQEKLPYTKLFYISIKPSISRWAYWAKMAEANAHIKKIINKNPNYTFVDAASGMLDKEGFVKQDIFIEDNLHMNQKGYAIWTEILKPQLQPVYDKLYP